MYNIQVTVNNIALAPPRLSSNANKLHVNLALGRSASKQVDLYCKQANAAAKVAVNDSVIPQ